MLRVLLSPPPASFSSRSSTSTAILGLLCQRPRRLQVRPWDWRRLLQLAPL